MFTSVFNNRTALVGKVKLTQDGDATTPAVYFASEPTLGFYRSSTGVLTLAGGSLDVGTHVIKFGDGAVATPSISFDLDADTGFWRQGSGLVDYTANNSNRIQFGPANLLLASAQSVTWGSTDNVATATADTYLSRLGANSVGLGAALSGITGNLSLGTLTQGTLALATTSTDGIVAGNLTDATGGATVQISPRLRFRGNAWNTAVTKTVDFFIENLPVTAATPTGILKFGYSLHGAAATYPMTLTSAGTLAALGPVLSGDGSATVAGLGFGSEPGMGLIRRAATAMGLVNSGAQWGEFVSGQFRMGSAGAVSWTSTADGATGADTFFKRGGVAQCTITSDGSTANSGDLGTSTIPIRSLYAGTSVFTGAAGTPALFINGAVAGAASQLGHVVKKITGIADNSAATILTVTVPNGNHACAVRLFMVSSNGSTDAFESNRAAQGLVIIERTTGKSAVTTAAAIADGIIATCATGGSATHTLAYSAVANAEGASGTETVSIKVTIDDSGNLGANQCVVYAEVLNTEATGCTIS